MIREILVIICAALVMIFVLTGALCALAVHVMGRRERRRREERKRLARQTLRVRVGLIIDPCRPDLAIDEKTAKLIAIGLKADR